jgi:hypothetical protein
MASALRMGGVPSFQTSVIGREEVLDIRVWVLIEHFQGCVFVLVFRSQVQVLLFQQQLYHVHICLGHSYVQWCEPWADVMKLL